MFRDLYKQANEEIKGDRAILDRAFQRAAQPVKKQPVIIKYSFIGTAAAAVLLVGAVFMNSHLFSDKNFEENIILPTEGETQIIVTPRSFNLPQVPDGEENAVEEQAAEQSEKSGRSLQNETADGKIQNEAIVSKEQENAISVAMAIEEDDSFEEPSEAPGKFAFFGKGRSVDNEEATDGSSSGGAQNIEAFSYMYDLSLYIKDKRNVVTEGFVNRTPSLIQTEEEAANTAMNECIVAYDTIDVYHDEVENIWKVHFYCGTQAGGDQIVYLNSDGITICVVYGE